jgi:hypothetical protein
LCRFIIFSDFKLFLLLLGGGSSLIYIDPSNLRRTTVTTAAAVTPEAPITMATTCSQLARSFGIVVRQIADLLTMLQDYHALAPTLPRILDISDQEALELQVCTMIKLISEIIKGPLCHRNAIIYISHRLSISTFGILSQFPQNTQFLYKYNYLLLILLCLQMEYLVK